MEATLGRIIIYAKNVERMCSFYEKFFGFKSRSLPEDRIIELVPPHGGACLMLHPAAKSVKTGQVTVKLVFDVRDVQKFCDHSLKNGLKFGTIHQADSYSFSNAKDPEKNSIQVSSRKFAAR